MPPVDEPGPGGLTEIAKNVRAGDVERIFVVISRKHIEFSGGRGERAQPNTAAQLECGFTLSFQLEELFGEHYRRRPDVGPVGKPLVLYEVFFANQVVGVCWFQDAESPVADR